MSENTRRVLMINSFLYLIALILALKIYAVSNAGPESVKVGLSNVNMWFRNLWKYDEGMDYSKLWYSVSGILSYVCIATCCFWIFLFVRDIVRSGRLDGVGTDKNLMATFFLYILTFVCWFLLKIMKINYGPVILPGQTHLTCSFPSGPVLLFVAAMGSTVFHIWERWSERKKAAIAATVVCTIVMGLGIAAQTICGTIWLTDTLGGLLLGITLLCLYSFFFYG